MADLTPHEKDRGVFLVGAIRCLIRDERYPLTGYHASLLTRATSLLAKASDRPDLVTTREEQPAEG